jgi:hypothetical protein
MLRLALRALHSYSSVGDIVGVEFELNGLVFGMIARGRKVVEGRVVMQVRREENQVKQLRPPIKDFWQTGERDFFQELFNTKSRGLKLNTLHI